jgi:DNA polymerase III delta prime subunit
MATNLDIHPTINNLLGSFIKDNKVPHLLFYGDYGSGKKTLANNFINEFYKISLNDNDNKNDYIMKVDCAHGKGIKFVRDDIKFFAKTNINCKNGLFKTIMLMNADQLTIDAQSALRRCIEIFSNSTRFILIIQNKDKILKPILSRFCEIYVDLPIINNKKINLHKYLLEQKNYNNNNIETLTLNNLHKIFTNERKKYIDKGELNIYNSVEKIYNNGYSIIDILNYFKSTKCKNIENINIKIIFLNELRPKVRSEQILILLACKLFIIRLSIELDNILIM